jgi:hypothetical protein
VALGVRVASQWCLLLLEVATSYTAWWLVALSKLARRLCEALEKICEGDYAHATRITKSNSSRACH